MAVHDMSRINPVALRTFVVTTAVLTVVWVPVRLWRDGGVRIAESIASGGRQAMAVASVLALIIFLVERRRGRRSDPARHSPPPSSPKASAPRASRRAATVALAVGTPLFVVLIVAGVIAGHYAFAASLGLLLLATYVTADESREADPAA